MGKKRLQKEKAVVETSDKKAKKIETKAAKQDAEETGGDRKRDKKAKDKKQKKLAKQ